MFANNLSKAVMVFLSVAFASHIAYKFFRKKNQRAPINEVIMFSSRTTELKMSRYTSCLVSRSMERLLYYVSSPRQSIDICMYVMTNTELIKVILKLHNRGIQIRVIMDAQMAFASGSAYKCLEKQGIPVCLGKSTNLMHHKFCLIDTLTEDIRHTPFVICGSLNWTNQALSSNWEDVVVTSQREIMQQYKFQFEKLWLQFQQTVDMA